MSDQCVCIDPLLHAYFIRHADESHVIQKSVQNRLHMRNVCLRSALQTFLTPCIRVITGKFVICFASKVQPRCVMPLNDIVLSGVHCSVVPSSLLTSHASRKSQDCIGILIALLDEYLIACLSSCSRRCHVRRFEGNGCASRARRQAC